MTIRNTHLTLALAVAGIAGLSSFHFAPDAPVAHPPADKGDKGKGKSKGDKPAGDPPADPPAADKGGATITLSEAELNLRIEKAQQEARAAWDKEQKDASDKAAKDKAKQDSDFRTLYESEQTRAKQLDTDLQAARLENKTLQVQIKLNEHLAEKAPDYVAAAKYILPLIKFEQGTKDDVIAGLITSAVEQFVKDNPRQVKASTPEPGSRGKAAPVAGVRADLKPDQPNERHQRQQQQALSYGRNF